MDFALVVPMFQQGEDLLKCINKAMAFLSAVASRFPPSNNELRMSSNPRNQATIQDGRVIVQQEAGQILNEEQLAFLADLRIEKTPVARQTILQNSAFHTEDLDAYESDCDDLSSAKRVLMANLSSCDSDVLSEVPYSDSYPNDMLNQDVQEMMYSEQTHIVIFLDNEIHSDSNIIPYSQYLQETQDADKENQTNKIVNESLTAELERYKERVAIFEQIINADSNNNAKLIDSQMDDLIRKRNAKFAGFQQEIDTLKETLSTHVKEKESLSKTLTCLELETKLFKKKDFIKKDVYDKLVKIYSTLEKHCISLEPATQLNQEIFQNENSGANQNAHKFNQLFEINELKAQSQEKDTVIKKLKEKIKSLSGKATVKNVKRDIDEIEAISIDLEHSMAKLVSKNENLRKEREHLKSFYKDQFDSIKKTRVRSKEHSDSLIAQINAKSIEN
ncbi:hypothetical protein Tco_0722467 [Tanacetum coccineum]